MIPEDEARNCAEFDEHFAILPGHFGMDPAAYRDRHAGRMCPEGFSYSSDRNTQWISVLELRRMLGLEGPEGRSNEPRIAA
jgi:hypothetical protein